MSVLHADAEFFVNLWKIMKTKRNQQKKEKSFRIVEYSSTYALMVFCYQNCSDLLWEKKISSAREKLLKFSKMLRSLEHFIQTVKGQNNLW